MNIVKELRKLLRFRVLIVRLWGGGGSYKSNSKTSSISSIDSEVVGREGGGGGSYKSNSTISSNSSVQQWGGEGVCKWQKFENFFDFGCYWGGEEEKAWEQLSST